MDFYKRFQINYLKNIQNEKARASLSVSPFIHSLKTVVFACKLAAKISFLLDSNKFEDEDEDSFRVFFGSRFLFQHSGAKFSNWTINFGPHRPRRR